MDPLRRPRLCLASPLFFPTYGGSQLRFMRYLPGFRARGFDVTVFTGTPPVNEVTDPELERVWATFPVGQALPPATVADTPVHRVRLPDTKGWRRTSIYNRALLRFCENPATRPDVVQLVGTLRAQSLPLIRRLRRLGIPVAYAVTVAPKKIPRGFSLNPGRIATTLLFNSLDCLVTNNHPLLEFVRAAGIRTRVEVIANGVNLNVFSDKGAAGERTQVRTGLNIGENDLVIATVGAVTPRKGTDILIEAGIELLRRHSNVQVLIVGPRKDQDHPGLDAFGARLDALIAASGRPERFHFAGLRDDVAPMLRASDIFVLPSDREGMPNSVLEAMACRLPVVITPFAGLSSDLGEAGREYLLAERNAAALAATLERLVADAALRARLADSGRGWVEATLDVERSIDRYAGLYRALIERGVR